MASTEDLAPETQSGTTRRTVLKAAGHAAWMIPAVQVASQVPALAAASTHGLTLSNPSHGHYYQTATTQHYQAQIQVTNTSGNSGKDDPGATLTATITGLSSSFTITNIAIGSGVTRTDGGGTTMSTTNGTITLTFKTTTLGKNNGNVSPSIQFIANNNSISTMSYNVTSSVGLSSDSFSFAF